MISEKLTTCSECPHVAALLEMSPVRMISAIGKGHICTHPTTAFPSNEGEKTEYPPVQVTENFVPRWCALRDNENHGKRELK